MEASAWFRSSSSVSGVDSVTPSSSSGGGVAAGAPSHGRAAVPPDLCGRPPAVGLGAGAGFDGAAGLGAAAEAAGLGAGADGAAAVLLGAAGGAITIPSLVIVTGPSRCGFCRRPGLECLSEGPTGP